MGIAIRRQIDARLVEGSFSRVAAQKAALAGRFYHYLFLEFPDAAAMFTKDFAHQKEMFANALAAGVHCLGQGGDLWSLGEDLHWQHRHLGLAPDHIHMAQRALHLAFGEVMKPDLTVVEVSAWNNAIRRLCQVLAAGVETPAA